MSRVTNFSGEDIALQDLLNAQTGKISWPELTRHFARGVVIRVGDGEDLLKVAEILVEDDAEQVRDLHISGKLLRASDEDAIRWQAGDAVFWAVVVAPWVLVQEIEGDSS